MIAARRRKQSKNKAKTKQKQSKNKAKTKQSKNKPLGTPKI
jgi:hypothetical protein